MRSYQLLIILATVLMVIPYFVIIGLPIYFAGALLSKKSGDPESVRRWWVGLPAGLIALWYGYILFTGGIGH